MSLKETLTTDMKTAMKARDQVRLGTIRLVLADLKNQMIAKGGELDDKDELALLSKHAKQRREAADAFTKGDRPELAANEEAELEIITGYLPAQLGEDEVRAMIAEIAAAVGATSKREMGKVMGKLMPRLQGRFDGNAARALVEQALS